MRTSPVSRSAVIGALLLGLLAVPGTASAQEPMCEELCTSSSPCEWDCYTCDGDCYYNPPRMSTCGESWTCDRCGPYGEWVETDRRFKHFFDKNWWVYAEIWGVQEIDEYRDSACGREYRTRCDEFHVMSWADCEYLWQGYGYICPGEGC
ncbi:hypothetical protein ACLESO_00525 [Pyxidicoccus sp. 3LG]